MGRISAILWGDNNSIDTTDKDRAGEGGGYFFHLSCYPGAPPMLNARVYV